MKLHFLEIQLVPKHIQEIIFFLSFILLQPRVLEESVVADPKFTMDLEGFLFKE